MTFELFLILLTLAGLIIGWVLHMVFDETEGGPTYLETLIYPARYPAPSYRWPFIVVFLIVGGVGAWYLP